MGAVDVAILDPQGHKDTARPTITQKADGVWVVEYSATGSGLHSVNVFFAGKSIPNSPFGVVVAPGLTLALIPAVFAGTTNIVARDKRPQGTATNQFMTL